MRIRSKTADSLKASLSPDFGWMGMDIGVIMGGIDVTSVYVDGLQIDIPVSQRMQS